MLKYKTYVRTLIFILVALVVSAFVYIYAYSKYYPIPIFHSVSLDAKMRFIRDLDDKERYDTIIIGSSIGLNNIQGIVLEESSEKVKNVINISALGLKITELEQLLELISFFPNAKRLIHSAQFEDFSETPVFEKSDIDFAKNYISLGKGTIDLNTAVYTFKHIVEFAKHHWEWEKEYAPNNTNYCLSFDRTGSVPLHIYGNDINQKRYYTPPPLLQSEENFLALERMAKVLKTKAIQLYFIVEPYRQPLFDKHPDLKQVRNSFSHRTKEIIEKNSGFFLDLHEKLRLNDDYFVDREHLNNKGSLLTAKEVAKFIDETEQ